MNRSLRRLILLPLLIIFFLRLGAQNGDCFAIAIGTESGQAGDTVEIPVYITQSISVYTFQFSIGWNPSQLQYAGLNLTGLDLDPISPVDFFSPQNGILNFVWFDPLVAGKTLPQNGILFKIKFKVTAASGFLGVSVNPNYSPTIFEIILAPSGDSAQPTTISGGIETGGTAGALQLNSICQVTPTCALPNGAIEVTVSGGQPPYTYQWSGPSGSITGADGFLQSPSAGVYYVTVVDAVGNKAYGWTRLFAKYNYLSIYPQTLQQPSCQANDGAITLTTENGTPPYTYQWEAPLGTGNTKSGLAPGEYEVTVTDAAGCSNSAVFTLTEDSGFYLSYGFSNPECGASDGHVSIFINGGPAPFQYLWNTGVTTQNLTNAPAGYYSVTATNALGCTETRSIFLNSVDHLDNWQYSTAFNCDSVSGGVGVFSLVMWNAQGLVPPVTLNWSTGDVQTVTNIEPNGAFFSELYGNFPPGNYYVGITDNAGCTLFAQINAHCDNAYLPVSSCFTLSMDASTPCKSIRASGFEQMKELDFSISWNPGESEFIKLQNIQLPDFDPLKFNLFEEQGAFRLRWESNQINGVTLPDHSTLFEMCFTGNKPHQFSDAFTPKARRADKGQIPFVAFDGSADKSLCALSPDCANDGRGGFDFEGFLGNPADKIKLYQHNTFQGEVDQRGLLRLPSGTWRAVYEGGGSWAPYKALLHIPPINGTDCIWPGDADNNAAANHHDLLYLGLAFSAAGPPRVDQTIGWNGLDSKDWPLSTPLRKINYSNIDTDGDGLITAADTAAIVQNWGNVIDPLADNPFNAPLAGQNTQLGPLLAVREDTLYEGNPAAIPILLGDASVPVEGMHGLSFSVSYDAEALEPEVYFKPQASWLGDPEKDLLWIQRNYPDIGRIDVAVTRKDGLPATGFGPVGTMYVIIEDDIFFKDGDEEPFKGEGDSIKYTAFYFQNIQALRPNESPIPIRGQKAEIAILKKTSGLVETDLSGLIRIAPNPAVDFCQIESEIPFDGIELSDSKGMVLQTRQYPASRRQKFDLGNLPSGVYTLKILTEKGPAYKKLLR